MANIKTNLRELSVAVTIGLLNSGKEFSLNELYDSRRFLTYADNLVKNDISSANNLLEYSIFPDELKAIIYNGYKLGKKIHQCPDFSFNENTLIEWVGNNTQKDDPVDIVIGDYAFSLKEDSFILENMGLYSLLNILTGTDYKKGMHIFSTFAQVEYDNWFSYSWNKLIEYLIIHDSWSLEKGNDISHIAKLGDCIILQFNLTVSEIPININTNEEYMKYTVSCTREKVFSKWIKECLTSDQQYIEIKKKCSEIAGNRVCNFINTYYKPDNVFRFFRIYEYSYYYAKTTSQETTLLKVPNQHDFPSIIKFLGCTCNVPDSQVNIISEFMNVNTGKILKFRNECRFSHGQFNGTPEAKMYVESNTSLSDLYQPIG